MGISTRSDSGRAPPNTADSDPARSTQTRESIVAFKLPSYSGGLSLPESRATSGTKYVRYGYIVAQHPTFGLHARASGNALFARRGVYMRRHVVRLRQSIDLSDRGNSRTEPKFPSTSEASRCLLPEEEAGLSIPPRPKKIQYSVFRRFEFGSMQKVYVAMQQSLSDARGTREGVLEKICMRMEGSSAARELNWIKLNLFPEKKRKI
ncbi:Uncharacterized protein DBV15_01149 [Temnothorax longispinosus]|uniref:Uncharacterized protein n=1 Tax=Temnothorax longispinosus TaxID=300112 RepID=A0A4S2J9F6_9HYME|nr:Uncharacterized protein DBV15_01149 [Temnothorax longispinosus]